MERRRDCVVLVWDFGGRKEGGGSWWLLRYCSDLEGWLLTADNAGRNSMLCVCGDRCGEAARMKLQPDEVL